MKTKYFSISNDVLDNTLGQFKRTKLNPYRHHTLFSCPAFELLDPPRDSFDTDEQYRNFLEKFETPRNISIDVKYSEEYKLLTIEIFQPTNTVLANIQKIYVKHFLLDGKFKIALVQADVSRIESIFMISLKNLLWAICKRLNETFGTEINSFSFYQPNIVKLA